MKSTVDKILEASNKSDEKEKLTQEQIEQLKACINRIFSSDDGSFFWKYLKKGMRVDVIEKDYNPMTLAGDKALRNVYLSIRAFMDPDVRAKLERGE